MCKLHCWACGREKGLAKDSQLVRGTSPELLISRPVCLLIRTSLFLPSGLWSLCLCSLAASACLELPGMRQAGYHQLQGVPLAIERGLPHRAPVIGSLPHLWCSPVPGQRPQGGHYQKLPERSETTSHHRLRAHAALDVDDGG